MSRVNRKFSPEERLSILQEAEREGTVETSRKYNLSPSLISKWKERYLTKGAAGLKPQYNRVDPQVRALEEENERLKRIIARQALELEVKGELLKKNTYSNQTKIAMVHQYQQKIGLKNLCQWVQLPLSSFHYKPLAGKPGANQACTQKMLDGKVVVNEEVIGSIKKLLSEEFVCYGYKKVSASLKQLKYLINDKKVYRLMDENNLLLGKVIRTTGKRQFVKHRKITATCPMDYLCLDIKYLWVHGEQRWYYLLSVIDVFSRKIIAWILQRSIKQIA